MQPIRYKVEIDISRKQCVFWITLSIRTNIIGTVALVTSVGEEHIEYTTPNIEGK